MNAIAEQLPKVSRSQATKALQAIFGPKAYFQKMREPAGLRVLVWLDGRFVEVAKATLKPGQTPSKEEEGSVIFALLQAAGRAVNRVIAFDPKLGVVSKQLPNAQAGRITEVQEADLCDALGDRNLPINAPFCESCTNCDENGATPCIAWGKWAVEQLKKASVGSPGGASHPEPKNE